MPTAAKMNPFLAYAGLKLIAVVFMMAAFEPLFGRSYFSYPDFAIYATCNPYAPNGLYALTICALGADNIAAPQVVALALVLMTVRDLAFIKLAQVFLSRPALLLFAVLLGAHPYLAAYHGRFTTISAASLGVLLLFWIIQSGRVLTAATALGFVLLAGLRNAMAPIYMAAIVVMAPAIIQSRSWGRAGLMAVTVVALMIILQLPETYASAFLSGAGRYPLSYQNIAAWVGSGAPVVDYIVAAPLLVISHGVLLLGFREAAFTSFPAPFWPPTPSGVAQLIAFSLLAAAHFVGTLNFYRRLGRARPALFLLLLTVIPSFLIVSHMRYYLPLIPIAMLGLAMFLDKKPPQPDPNEDRINSG